MLFPLFSVIAPLLLLAAPSAAKDLSVIKLGSYTNGVPSEIFDESAAEILAYDSCSMRILVTNAFEDRVDVLDFSDPTDVKYLSSLDLLGGPNSVDIYDSLAAVAVQNADPSMNGFVQFFDVKTLEPMGTVEVGNLPDMVTFTPDGKYVLTANEGEPFGDYVEPGVNDPEGSVSIIDVSDMSVKTLGFEKFNDKKEELIAMGVRIFGPGATVAQDLEPEYIAVSEDSKTAVVNLQENNAFAIVDLKNMEITDIVPLGFKDHSIAGNELDASNRDDLINIQNWPVLGMYQPDGIKSFEVDGHQFYISANEGDARDYDGFSEEFRVGDFCEEGLIDETAFGGAAAVAELCLDENLGRLRVTSTLGLNENGLYEELYNYGGRSFSIFDEDFHMIYDSASDLEQITAALAAEGKVDFNANNDENGFDARSDDKGPEPEGVVVGKVGDGLYAFVLLERISGVAVFDVSDPHSPEYVTYFDNRDFTVGEDNISDGSVGDLGPEDALFIPAKDSPIGLDLLVVANEVSGTVTTYLVSEKKDQCPGVEPPCKSIAEIACTTEDFSTLCAAVQAAGLGDALSGGEWTVFAPTNAAFEALPDGILDAVLADVDLLTSILLFHAVPGSVFASDLVCAGLVTMASGENSRTVCHSDGAIFQKGSGNPRDPDQLPEIVATDIAACNGVIHVVDNVLLP